MFFTLTPPLLLSSDLLDPECCTWHPLSKVWCAARCWPPSVKSCPLAAIGLHHSTTEEDEDDVGPDALCPFGFPLPYNSCDVAAGKNQDNHGQVLVGRGRHLVLAMSAMRKHAQAENKGAPDKDKDPASHFLADLAFSFVDDLTQGIKDKEDKIQEQTEYR